MNTKTLRAISTGVAGFVLLLCVTTAKAQLINVYTQDFNNSSGSDQSTSYDGFNTYHGSTASAYAGTSAVHIDPQAGSDGNPGVLYYDSANTNITGQNVFVESTDIASSDIDISEVNDITFEQKDDVSDEDFSLSLELGGVWYVSQTTFDTSIGATSYVQQTLNLLPTTEFYTLTFTAGTILSLSTSTTTLPTTEPDVIQGIGFYTPDYSTTGNSRIDTLEVQATPEPPIWVMVGVGIFLIGYRLRRKMVCL